MIVNCKYCGEYLTDISLPYEGTAKEIADFLLKIIDEESAKCKCQIGDERLDLR